MNNPAVTATDRRNTFAPSSGDPAPVAALPAAHVKHEGTPERGRRGADPQLLPLAASLRALARSAGGLW